VEGAEPVTLYGFPHGVGLEPVTVNVERMAAIFRQGARDLREVWEKALSPETLAQVAALGATGGAPAFPDELWVHVVYDFAVAYHRRALAREQLLRSLVPLYLGRTAAFVVQAADSTAEEVEGLIHRLADEFAAHKAYLRRRWS
jgi:hypothetical protein